jgi:multisubunit Na+/H+ antiporter MnhB subunit
MLFATLSDRRVRAVLAVVILTVSSVLVSFLYLLDKSLAFTKQIAFLSVMEYYRPIGILMEGQIPWRNLGILGGITAGLWILTAIILSRRDVTTT